MNTLQADPPVTEPLPKPTAEAQHSIGPHVWVVVPSYNEGERLLSTLRKLMKVAPNVVVVDDGSRDNAALQARELGAWVLRHPVNCGQGAALQTGFDFALARGAKVVVTFDSDGQHDAEQIADLVGPVDRGECDVALGSRFLGSTVGMTLTRWMVLKAGVLFTRFFAGIRVTDTHNGFRALSRSALMRVRIRENRMAHASELLHKIQRAGLRYREVPVTITYNDDLRAKGQSSWNALRIAARYLAGNMIK